jgi:peptide/nickel transport system substrate-binding protein
VLNLESGGSSFFLGIEGAEEYVERGRARGDISGIETNDETGEITIRLKEPDGSFPYVLAMNFAAVVPGDTPFQDMTKDPPPGVGPFVLERVRQSRGFDLVRNPNWQEIDGIPSARLDRIRVDVRTSDRRQAQDVMRNRVDYMFDPPPADQLREVRARYADRYEEFVTNSTYYFFLNTKVPPFDRKEVRQAVNLAIDKRALSRLFGGMLEPTCNFLPPDMQGHRRIDPCPYGDPMEEPDLEQAREFVRRAGAEGARVDVYGHAEEPSRPVVEYLADTLGRIGLKARPKLIDPEVYFETIGNQRTKAQIGFANWFQDFPHPRNFLLPVDPSAIQQTNNQNYSNVDDDEIRARLKEANALPLEDAAPLYEEIDRRLIDEAYVAPYGHRKLASFFSDRVDVERCTVTHPVYQLDFSQLCLK